jgi:hypothetical protein
LAVFGVVFGGEREAVGELVAVRQDLVAFPMDLVAVRQKLVAYHVIFIKKAA